MENETATKLRMVAADDDRHPTDARKKNTANTPYESFSIRWSKKPPGVLAAQRKRNVDGQPDRRHGTGDIGHRVRGTQDIGHRVRGTQDIGHRVRGTEDIGHRVRGTEDIGHRVRGTEDIGCRVRGPKGHGT